MARFVVIMAIRGADFVIGKTGHGVAGGAEVLPRSAAEVTETDFHGPRQRALARPIGRDGSGLRLHLPQDELSLL